MKANRSISMTLLVLMLVSSWSVPADAGLLDRLCRIGRARTTECRPVRKQGLLGRLFRCRKKDRYYVNPETNVADYCPVEKVLDVMEGDRCILSLYRMTICNSVNETITALPCDTQPGTCSSDECSVPHITVYPITIQIGSYYRNANNYHGDDMFGYSDKIDGVSRTTMPLRLVFRPQDFSATSLKVRVGTIWNSKTYQLFRLTSTVIDPSTHQPVTYKRGFGIEITNDRNVALSNNYDIYSVPNSKILQFQQRQASVGEDPWVYLVYPANTSIE